MENFVTLVHLIVALMLIGIVLVQDSKSSSAGGAFGGGGSNSILGATGGATLAQKITRWVAVIFASTCIILTIQSGKSRSVVDSMPSATDSAAAPAAAPAPAAPAQPPSENTAPAKQ